MVYQRKFDYEYREGWHPNVDANTVGGMIEKIEKDMGTVTSELFLEASRPEDSPTHNVFEWDDSIAAEKYRLHQASRTICAIRIVVRDGTAEPTRAFVNVASKESKTAQYMNVTDAMADENTRKAVLSRALRELRIFQEKYENLTEFAGVFREIEKIKKG